MKLIKTLIISSLIMSSFVLAMTAKSEKPVKMLEGTSIGKYIKPGASVDITYKSTQVEAGEVSDVSITLSTALTSGTMDVKLKMDKGLSNLSNINDNLTFEINENEKSFPINLEVTASDDGLYYIKLLVKIKGDGMRAFAVPVHVGEGKLNKEAKKIEKSSTGENLSVSPAVETIER